MSPRVSFERVGSTRCRVGESPLWAPAEQALYWVDIEGRVVHRHEPATGRAATFPMSARPACLGLHAEGGLLCALEDSIVRLQPSEGPEPVRTPVARVVHPEPGMRFNDGRCDRQGRFWVGSMAMDMARAQPAGSLYCLGARGLSQPQVSGLLVPNGLAFSPEGRILYLSDSHPASRLIWAFDLDEDGGLHRRRVHVDMNLHPGRPDGAAVDADGCYWTCANDAGMVHRFTPEGRLDRSLEVPARKPSMCAFGGPRLDELYVTTIAPADLRPEEAATAGATWVCRPGVRGLAETPFANGAHGPNP